MQKLFPWVALLVILASLYFFYRAVGFLAAQDYVAATLALFVGFALIKSGVEIARVARRREEGP